MMVIQKENFELLLEDVNKNTITKNYTRKEKRLFAESTHSNWEMKQTRTGYTK